MGRYQTLLYGQSPRTCADVGKAGGSSAGSPTTPEVAAAYVRDWETAAVAPK
jgi:hypothetical protein